MKKIKDLIKIYTGPETSAILLKTRFEEFGIYTLTKNDFTGSFMGVVQPSIDLWIKEYDFQKAKSILDDFILNQQSDTNHN